MESENVVQRWSMSRNTDILTQKIEFIMESPSERVRYKNLPTFKEKLSFLKNHFIMSDMAVRLMERQYLLSPSSQERLMDKVDDIIEKFESA